MDANKPDNNNNNNNENAANQDATAAADNNTGNNGTGWNGSWNYDASDMMSKFGMCCCISVCAVFCSCCGFYIAILVMLGMHGFGSTDPAHCYYIEGIERPALSAGEVITAAKVKGVDVPPGQPLDYHVIFTQWCVWAFWLLILPIFVSILGSVFSYFELVEKKTEKMIGKIVSLCVCLTQLIWCITGIINRYSHGGKICSGDMLKKKAGTTEHAFQTALKAASEARGYQIGTGPFVGVAAWILTILNAFGVVAIITFLFMECFWPESVPDFDKMGDDKKDKGDGIKIGGKSKEELK